MPSHFSNGRCQQFSNSPLTPLQVAVLAAVLARFELITRAITALIYIPVFVLHAPLTLALLAAIAAQPAEAAAPWVLQLLLLEPRTPAGLRAQPLHVSRVCMRVHYASLRACAAVVMVWAGLVAPLALAASALLGAAALPLQVLPWVAGGVAWALPAPVAWLVGALAALPLGVVAGASSAAWLPVSALWALGVWLPASVACAGGHLVARGLAALAPRGLALLCASLVPRAALAALAEPPPAWATCAFAGYAVFYALEWAVQAKGPGPVAAPPSQGGSAAAAPREAGASEQEVSPGDAV